MRYRFRIPVTAILAASISACASVNEAGANSRYEPQNPYGLYLGARSAASAHDLADAAALYRDSLAFDPKNPDLLDKAFLYTAASGDFGKAVRLAKQMVEVEPDNRAARLALAIDNFKSEDYTQARDQLSKSAKGPFTALTISLLDAWASQGQGNTDAALADLKSVPGEGGTDTLAAFQSALILDLAGRADAADAAYRQTLQAGASPRASDAYGRFLERAGRQADARALYEKAKSDASLSAIAASGLARIQSGEKPDRLVTSPSQGAAEALFGIAASLTDQSSADIAILYLQFSLVLSPDFDLAKIVLADRYEAVGKYAEAIAIYRSVSDNSPYKTASEIQIAIDESRANKNDQAIADLAAITKAHPDDLSAWTSLGDLYRTAEKYPEAKDAYDHAVALLKAPSKDDWPLFFARAAAEDQSGHWDLAEADLVMALKLSPEQAQVLNFLGYSWVDKGQHLAEALAMLEKARALSPYDGYIVDSVGWAYYRLGRYADAARTLESAVLLVPGDSTINEHLGDAYWRVGKKLDARFQWSHALAFGPEAAQKTKLERKLKNGLDTGGNPA